MRLPERSVIDGRDQGHLRCELIWQGEISSDIMHACLGESKGTEKRLMSCMLYSYLPAKWCGVAITCESLGIFAQRGLWEDKGGLEIAPLSGDASRLLKAIDSGVPADSALYYHRPRSLANQNMSIGANLCSGMQGLSAAILGLRGMDCPYLHTKTIVLAEHFLSSQSLWIELTQSHGDRCTQRIW